MSFRSLPQLLCLRKDPTFPFVLESHEKWPSPFDGCWKYSQRNKYPRHLRVDEQNRSRKRRDSETHPAATRRPASVPATAFHLRLEILDRMLLKTLAW